MIRVTTPTHTFTLPMETSDCSEIQVTYKQGKVSVVKHYQDGVLPSGMSLDGDDVMVRLTQEETKQFKATLPAEAQVRVLTLGGDAYASQIFKVTVGEVLNEGVLADA